MNPRTNEHDGTNGALLHPRTNEHDGTHGAHGNTLEAHEVALEAIRIVRPIIEKVARHDSDLAKQMRRAATSAPSNLAEGNRRKGGDRLHLFSVALGSADELKTQLRITRAWGYAPEAELTSAIEIVDRVCAMTYRLLYPRA